MKRLISDYGYTDTYWIKINDNLVLGCGEVADVCGTLIQVESFVFNEFAKEAVQIGTKVYDFRIDSKIKCLQNLRDNVSTQLEILNNEKLNQPNTSNTKINKQRRVAERKSKR